MKQFEISPMVTRQELLRWASVHQSSYYYKRGNGLQGRKPSTMTITRDGELVDNTVVLQDAEAILQQEFCWNICVWTSSMCTSMAPDAMPCC